MLTLKSLKNDLFAAAEIMHDCFLIVYCNHLIFNIFTMNLGYKLLKLCYIETIYKQDNKVNNFY